jgi:hypothetical protein
MSRMYALPPMDPSSEDQRQVYAALHDPQVSQGIKSAIDTQLSMPSEQAGEVSAYLHNTGQIPIESTMHEMNMADKAESIARWGNNPGIPAQGSDNAPALPPDDNEYQ